MDYAQLKKLPRKQLEAAVPEGFKFKLRPWDHQLAAWLAAISEPGFNVWLDLGTGKTKVAIDTVRFAQKYAGRKLRTLVVCLDTAVGNWLDEIRINSNDRCVAIKPNGYLPDDETLTNKERRFCLMEGEGFFVINYESLRHMLTIKKPSRVKIVKGEEKVINKMAPDPAAMRRLLGLGFDAIICDESHKCVMAGTKIATPQGSKSIENVEVGDVVIGFCHNSGKLLETAVTGTMTNSVTTDKLFTISDRLTITEDHPIFTEAGEYKDAKEIDCQKDKIIKLLDLPNLQEQNNSNSRQDEWTTGRSEKWKNQTRPFLLFKVLCNLASVCSRNKRKDAHPSKTSRNERKVTQKHSENTASSCGTKKAVRASYGSWQSFQRSVCESQGYKSKFRKAWLEKFKWWKWTWFNFATEVAFGTVSASSSRLETRTGCENSSEAALSNLLQNRLGESNSDDCNRSQRSQSQRRSKGFVGPKEKSFFGKHGLECVCFEKRKYSEGSENSSVKVYNLETSTGNYFAENILVHNCKDIATLNYKIMARLATDIPLRLLLTGTPYGKSLLGIWGQYYIVDFGQTYGTRFTDFRAKHFKDKGYFGPEWKVTKEGRKAIEAKLFTRAIRYSEAEIKDMPPKVYRELTFNLSAEQQHQYDDATDREGEFSFLENRSMLFRQICSGIIVSTEYIFKENPKLKLLQDLLESVVDEHKVVIFHQFIMESKLIIQLLKHLKLKYCVLNGATKDKYAEYKRFELEPSSRVMVAHPLSGGSSINMNVARYCVFFSNDHSPINRAQCEKRIHRGEIKESRFYYDLLANNSIEISMHAALKRNMDLFAKAMDGKRWKKILKGEAVG